MRLFPLFAVSLALVMAGCAKDDPPPATTSPTSTSPTTTTTTSTPTTSTPTTTTPTVPTKPAPAEVATGTFDVSQYNPAAPPAAKAFTVPVGYTTLTLNVTWTCAAGAPACVADGTATIKAGGLSCGVAQGPIQAAIVCTKEGAATVGEGKVEFTATAPNPIQGAFKVIAS